MIPLEATRLLRERGVRLALATCAVAVLVALIAGALAEARLDAGDEAAAVARATRLKWIDEGWKRIAAGLDPEEQLDYDPRDPQLALSRAEPLATLPRGALALLAAGESDQRRTHGLVSCTARLASEVDEELRSPLLARSGSFDWVFVVVWCVPLLVLATAGSGLAEERARGVLLLVATHAPSLARFTLRRLAWLWFFFSAVVAVATIFGLALLADGWTDELGRLAWVLLVVAAYMAAWCAIAGALGALVRFGAAAPALLGGAWAAFLLVIPAWCAHTADAAAEGPSRDAVARMERAAGKESWENPDVAAFIATHGAPERVVDPEQDAGRFQFFGYLTALRRHLEPARRERVAAVETRLARARALEFASPALAARAALVELAGTGAESFQRFAVQRFALAEQREALLFRKAAREEPLVASDYEVVLDGTPAYAATGAPIGGGRRVALLLAFALLGTGLLVALQKRRSALLLQAS
jgi:hypothetical protein